MGLGPRARGVPPFSPPPPPPPLGSGGGYPMAEPPPPRPVPQPCVGALDEGGGGTRAPRLMSDGLGHTPSALPWPTHLKSAVARSASPAPFPPSHEARPRPRLHLHRTPPRHVWTPPPPLGHWGASAGPKAPSAGHRRRPCGTPPSPPPPPPVLVFRGRVVPGPPRSGPSAAPEGPPGHCTCAREAVGTAMGSAVAHKTRGAAQRMRQGEGPWGGHQQKGGAAVRHSPSPSPYGPPGLTGQQRRTRGPSPAGPRAGKRSARPGTPPPATSAPGRGSVGPG